VYEQKRRSEGCVRCSEDDQACLDYHHRADTEKEMTICEMVTHGYSKSKLRAEIAKCEPLCANCHREEHYEVPDGVRTDDSQLWDADE